jgi:hypothetical protein
MRPINQRKSNSRMKEYGKSRAQLPEKIGNSELKNIALVFAIFFNWI